MNRILGGLLVAAFGVGISVTAEAGSIRTIDCNPDMYNLTGQTANDFDIVLGNIDASDVSGVYSDPTLSHNPFPTHTVSDLPDGNVLVRYSGAEVPDRTSVHVGISVPYLSGNPYVVDQYWTRDGINIGSPTFRCNLDPVSYTDGAIRNAGSTAAWVQRRVLHLSNSVTLDQLLPDEALWSAASLIDAAPVRVGAGQSLGYVFANSGDGAYLMAYDVWNDDSNAPGALSQRLMQAFNVVPEPSPLLLLVCPALVFAFRGRRRRVSAG